MRSDSYTATAMSNDADDALQEAVQTALAVRRSAAIGTGSSSAP